MKMNVQIGMCVSVLYCLLCYVNSFPYKRSYVPAEYQSLDPYLLQDLLEYYPTDDFIRYPLRNLNKRGQTKRYSLSDLLARLRAMVGSDEVLHSGHSSYLRFGAGGK